LIGGEIVTISADASLKELAELLSMEGVGSAIVGVPGEVEGIVSERDIVDAVAAGKDPATTLVSAIASRQVAWADAGAPVAEVAAEMFDHWVRHIPVERDGRLIGVVSARDLLGAYLSMAGPDI
jgi:CBS domain-containing protein